jgi:hypothetical protein
MLSSLVVLLLLVAPVAAEWSCPEPSPESAATEVMDQTLLLKLVGTRGESASGILSDDLFPVGPHVSVPRPWRVVVRLGESERYQVGQELRQRSLARLHEAPLPEPEPEAAALAAAMVDCAEEHGGSILPRVEGWALAQGEREPPAVLARLLVLEPTRVWLSDVERAAIAAAAEHEALDRLAWRFLQLGQPGEASHAWEAAAQRSPRSPAAPRWLELAAASGDEVPFRHERASERHRLLALLAAALAPGSDWSRAQPRSLRREHGVLRADADLELAAACGGADDRVARLQAWIRAHQRDSRVEQVHWIALCAALGEGQSEEVARALRVGALRGDPHRELLAVAVTAKRLAPPPEDPKGRGALQGRLLAEVEALSAASFTEPALREVAVELGLSAACWATVWLGSEVRRAWQGCGGSCWCWIGYQRTPWAKPGRGLRRTEAWICCWCWLARRV